MSKRETNVGFRTRWIDLPTAAPGQQGARRIINRAVKWILWAYLRAYHGFTFRYDPGLPVGRPYLAVFNHTSMLDVPALMVADVYDPPTAMVIKSSALRVPGIDWVLRQWGAIPVDRRGRDLGALREIRGLLAAGQGVCVAPSGTRSRDGRVGPVNPVLLRLMLQSNAAVFPVVILGARECLPKGARFPRPGRISLDTGPEIDLERFRGRRLTPSELVEAAEVIQNALAARLPESMGPAPGQPVLGAYSPGET